MNHAHPTPEMRAEAPAKVGFLHLCAGCDAELHGAFCPSCDDVMPGYFLREDAPSVYAINLPEHDPLFDTRSMRGVWL